MGACYCAPRYRANGGGGAGAAVQLREARSAADKGGSRPGSALARSPRKPPRVGRRGPCPRGWSHRSRLPARRPARSAGPTPQPGLPETRVSAAAAAPPAPQEPGRFPQPPGSAARAEAAPLPPLRHARGAGPRGGLGPRSPPGRGRPLPPTRLLRARPRAAAHRRHRAAPREPTSAAALLRDVRAAGAMSGQLYRPKQTGNTSPRPHFRGVSCFRKLLEFPPHAPPSAPGRSAAAPPGGGRRQRARAGPWASSPPRRARSWSHGIM